MDELSSEYCIADKSFVFLDNVAAKMNTCEDYNKK